MPEQTNNAPSPIHQAILKFYAKHPDTLARMYNKIPVVTGGEDAPDPRPAKIEIENGR